MQNGWNGAGARRRRCGSSMTGSLALIGAVLIAAGLLVLFLCVPDWAWLALLGAGLIAVGCLLVKRSMGGR